MSTSLADILRAHFAAHGDERAYGQRRGYRTEWFTYSQVLEMAFQFSGELAARGIGQGERIMLWGRNSAEWVVAFLGSALVGVVVVPMDDAAAPDFAMRVFRQVEAKLLICSREHDTQIRTESLRSFTLICDDLSKTLNSQSATPIPQIKIAAADILQIVFTSGATADPKGVVITHGNVLANLAPLETEIKKYLKYERWVHPVRFLNLLPLSHIFGQFLGMFLPPMLAGTVIFQEEFTPAEIVETIRRERVSVLVGVPRVLQSLKQRIERDLEDSGQLEAFKNRFANSQGKHFLQRWWIFRDIRRQFGWKFCAFICGGAALDSATEEFWGRLGYAAIQGYGLTETTSLISVNHPFKLGQGSIGKVLPGREIKLAADGEILVRGGGVAAGYWGANESATVADRQGWYRTGDIGALDDSGNLYFKGRKKEVIVTPAGLNIYPGDLEAALRSQSEVRDCVVVGMERAGNAEPCAVIILRRGDANGEEIVQRANQLLADFQRIRLWLPWPDEDFPRTSTQKPRRNVIAEFATRQLLASPEADAEPSLLVNLIARITGRRARDLNRETKLDSDLGLNSLDRAALLGALEDRYQIPLSEAGFDAVRTVGDIEKMLAGESRPRLAYRYPSWALRWPIPGLRGLAQNALLLPAVYLLAWPRIEGRENLAGVKGPLLVVCNHIGDVDFAFILAALPPRLRRNIAIATRGEALEALHSPAPDLQVFRKIFDRAKWTLGVSLLNLFPLPQRSGFRKSFAYAGQAVDRGYSILVFPEGRHTADGKIFPFRAGIGLLAKNLNISVLPMRIDGLFAVKRAGKRFASARKISVRIGHPIRFPAESDPTQIARDLQSVVESL
jgi:long-chain acyl-CoA synthetase